MLLRKKMKKMRDAGLENIKINLPYEYIEIQRKYKIVTAYDLLYCYFVLDVEELKNKRIDKLIKKYLKLPKKDTYKDVLPVFSTYDRSAIDMEILKEMDRRTSCNVIPYKTPSITNSAIFFDLSRKEFLKYTQAGKQLIQKTINVKQFKERLNLYDIYGKPYYGRGMTTDNRKRLNECIDLYDRQVVQLISESGLDRPISFYTDYDEKMEIISENKYEIVAKLLDSSDRFLFGNLSDNHKFKIYEGLDKNNAYGTEMLNILTNYSTLRELEENPTEPAVIKKLIR